MRTTCILTDSSAQFPNHSFPGQNLVRIIPYDVEIKDTLYPEGRDFNISDLSRHAPPDSIPRLIAPSIFQFTNYYQKLGQEFDQIIVLCQSDHLSLAYRNAVEATDGVKGGQPVLVINSQTTSAGLGFLAQVAAEAAYSGMQLNELERIIRKQIGCIYTIFCAPGLSYFSATGIVDQTQAIVGEMLNILPVFTIEEERVTPLEKVRNYRSALELFAEFIEEFEKLKHIALIQSAPPPISDTRAIRQLFQELYPAATYSEHKLNAPLAITFGPRFLGLIAAE